MLLEKQLDQAVPAPPDVEAEKQGEFWLQETVVRGARRAIIHASDCPECEGRKYPGSDQWHGPFAELNYARESSDRLSGVAIRAECRCVRRGTETDLPRVALLNEPLFRKPEPVAPQPKPKPKREAAKAASATQKKTTGKKKPSRRLQYGVLGGSAVMAICLVLLFVPALSVVEASDHASSPFLLANGSHLAVTDLAADCSVELQPAGISLRSTHQKLAERLAPNSQVGVPCFQAVGGSTPETRGMTMQLKLSYVMFGIRHVEQTFTFVAARNTNGICRWVEKSQL